MTREPVHVPAAGPPYAQSDWRRVFDEDGSYNDYNSILDPMLTLNIQTPQVPGEITLNWTDFVTGEDGWRIQRSSDGVNFSWYKNVQIAHDDQTVRSTPCHWRALSVIAPAT